MMKSSNRRGGTQPSTLNKYINTSVQKRCGMFGWIILGQQYNQQGLVLRALFLRASYIPTAGSELTAAFADTLAPIRPGDSPLL